MLQLKLFKVSPRVQCFPCGFFPHCRPDVPRFSFPLSSPHFVVSLSPPPTFLSLILILTLYIRNSTDTVQLALISPALGELAGCGFFPKGARSNPMKRSVCHMFSNSLLALAAQPVPRAWEPRMPPGSVVRMRRPTLAFPFLGRSSRASAQPTDPTLVSQKHCHLCVHGQKEGFSVLLGTVH